jgi:hypothetical protein
MFYPLCVPPWLKEMRERVDRAMTATTSARNKDTYYVPLERLNKNRDFLSDFFSKRYRARAIFRGSDLDQAFQLLHEVIIAIQVSAGMLIRAVGDERREPSFWEKREADIWDSFDNEQDALTPKIKKALSVAEAWLGPILEASARSPDADKR